MNIDASIQYVEFGIGSERYAVPIRDIHEIIRMQEITRLPHAASFVNGVINLRGQIVPVISLRKRFGLSEEEFSRRTRIVVVNRAEEKMGIIVDHVNKVVRFHDVQEPPERLGALHGRYFEGIGKSDNGIVTVLKLGPLFEDEAECM